MKYKINKVQMFEFNNVLYNTEDDAATAARKYTMETTLDVIETRIDDALGIIGEDIDSDKMNKLLNVIANISNDELKPLRQKFNKNSSTKD